MQIDEDLFVLLELELGFKLPRKPRAHHLIALDPLRRRQHGL